MKRFTIGNSTAAIATTLLLGACASQVPVREAAVPASDYARTFQLAQAELRERRFAFDRVDAPQGILTTLPKEEPGLAKPWEAPPGLDQATEDLLTHQRRLVQVVFVPASQDAPAPASLQDKAKQVMVDPDRDLIEQPTDLRMVVRVLVERIERPGLRVSPDSVRLASQTIDPQVEGAGLWPRFSRVVREDDRLAGEILRDIQQRIAKPQ
jgi:hypothetical protein